MVAVGWPRVAVQYLNIILSALIHMPDEICKTGNKPFYGWLILLNILWSNMLAEYIFCLVQLYLWRTLHDKCKDSLNVVDIHAICLINHINWTLYEVFFTWFFKFFVDKGPWFRDSWKAFFHGLNVRVGAVTLWKFWVTLAPAVIVSADKRSFTVAGDVTESCFDESVSEIFWQNDLQPYRKEKLMKILKQ